MKEKLRVYHIKELESSKNIILRAFNNEDDLFNMTIFLDDTSIYSINFLNHVSYRYSFIKNDKSNHNGFYIVEDSEYINWLVDSSYGIKGTANDFLHYALLAKNCRMDILVHNLCYYMPRFFMV